VVFLSATPCGFDGGWWYGGGEGVGGDLGIYREGGKGGLCSFGDCISIHSHRFITLSHFIAHNRTTQVIFISKFNMTASTVPLSVSTVADTGTGSTAGSTAAPSVLARRLRREMLLQGGMPTAAKRIQVSPIRICHRVTGSGYAHDRPCPLR
jgi:hypothetical protein